MRQWQLVPGTPFVVDRFCNLPTQVGQEQGTVHAADAARCEILRPRREEAADAAGALAALPAWLVVGLRSQTPLPA